MSDRSDRRDDATHAWVVHVTAPLATGRVREVAADAAGRLKLPVEKLVALLENRIGPVTKPLPHASATRVAEVLDLAGAEVSVRPATEEEMRSDPPGETRGRPASDAEVPSDAPSDAPVPPVASTPPAAAESEAAESEAGQSEATQAEAEDTGPTPHSSNAAGPAATEPEPGEAEPTEPEPMPVPEEPADPVREEVDPDDAERDAIESNEPPPTTPPIGRAGRGAGTPRGRPREERDVDPWASLDAEEDEAMLGDWRRSPASTASAAAAAPRPEPVLSEGAPRKATPSAPGPAGHGHDPVHDAATADAPARTPIAQRPPAREDDEDEDNEWAYGLRDPFAEAEARERAVRRWVLMIALLVASTVFVALQWAYSRSGPSDRTPPAYAEGLAAYRDGAFVSAARAWIPRAEAGDVRAMYMLGWMAEFGQGRPWSNREAASWYRQAAERGHAPSQERLARLYREGLGVDRDLDAALRWSLAAAQAGRPGAQRDAALGLAHQGRLDEARAWLSRAARRDPEAAAWWSIALDDPAATSDSR